MSKQGVIYILTNPSFPEYVKIGYASNLERRLKESNRSETIPFAFRVYAIYEVESNLTDKELHKLIDTLNPDLRTVETFDGKQRVKEFYAMSAEDAYLLLESIAKISGTQNRLKRMTPEGHEIIDEQLAEENRKLVRRGPLKFSDCGIPTGSELVFVGDSNIKVTVVDDRHISYNGQKTSLTRLAKDLKGSDRSIQGPLWFTYQGKKLTDIRDEVERHISD